MELLKRILLVDDDWSEVREFAIIFAITPCGQFRDDFSQGRNLRVLSFRGFLLHLRHSIYRRDYASGEFPRF